MFHRDLAATDRLRDIGTANLIRAADAVGATRFLTQSFFLGYGWSDHGVAPLREDSPFAGPSTGPFEPHLRSLRSTEHQVRSIGGIALRYGMFYGPERTTRAMMTDLRRRRLPAPKHPGVLHPIHIDDAATATVAAHSLGSAGEAYNIGDDCPVDMGVYLDALADAAGARHPLRLPNWALGGHPVPLRAPGDEQDPHGHQQGARRTAVDTRSSVVPRGLRLADARLAPGRSRLSPV